MIKISVSILSKNNIQTVLKLNETDMDYLHIDAMDGKFVNDINFSTEEIIEISHWTNKKLDIHLMVENPLAYIEKLNASEIEYITVHYEVLNGDYSIFEKIKNKGIKCGISVNPNTNIKEIFNLLNMVDLVLIMSVEPGYSGQMFMESSLEKVKLLRNEINKQNLKTLISIDGGINKDNASSCIKAGCNILVSGSYIINSKDWQSAIDALKN